MMNSPELELADIFRGLDLEELERKGPPLSAAQRRVLRDLMQCRTAALSGTSGAMRPVRSHSDRLQLLPEPPLSEMSGRRARRLA